MDFLYLLMILKLNGRRSYVSDIDGANMSGWYEIHMPKTGSPNFAQLYRFVTERGSIIKYSNNKYVEWLKNSNLSLGVK